MSYIINMKLQLHKAADGEAAIRPDPQRLSCCPMPSTYLKGFRDELKQAFDRKFYLLCSAPNHLYSLMIVHYPDCKLLPSQFFKSL